MRLLFYGADREVTGSCHGVEANGRRVLVDCGMVQGSDNSYGQDFPFDPAKIDCVVLTHAHIDHSGRLPLLVKQGFAGKIYSTGATAELLKIMLRDSAHIQELEAEWKSKKRRRAGREAALPLYTVADAEEVFKYLVPCPYGEDIHIAEGVRVCFTDAGHLLGSASVEMWLTESAGTKKIVFSGDIGNLNQPIIRDPQYIAEADMVVMESTYGDRNHEPSDDYVVDLARIIDETLSSGGNVIFPSFAIGRAQELLYFIREMKERGLVRSAPDFPVYVDSPLANAATRIFEGDLEGYLDDETLAVIRSGREFLRFDGLRVAETTEESKAINSDPTPKVIISSSGMCEAGRIRHHLRHNLWRPECAVVFVGFQAKGTLGRVLVDRAAEKVTLFGEEIAVRCKIHSFRGMSAHADRDGLLKWIGSFDPKPEKVFVVHGEEEVCDIFVKTLAEKGFNAVAPRLGAAYDAFSGEFISEGRAPEARTKPAPGRGLSPAYKRLIAAGRRLLDVITRNYGGPDRDLNEFADQILKLAGRWDR